MMKKTLFIALATASLATAEQVAVTTNTVTNVSTNTPTPPKTISLQEMLVIGHSGLKLHSLAMITQGKVQGDIDESFMPGFKACAEDTATPVRSIAAQLMGRNLVAGLDKPNKEAVELLMKLAKDESSDVRFNSVYHGLSQLKVKSDDVVALLLEVAADNREHSLYERISESLTDSREQVIRILDKKLETEDSIAVFEIYADMTGKSPADSGKFMDMPSSRPKMFIFKGDSDDIDSYKAELTNELKLLGIETPDLVVSGPRESQILLLKTYITKDRIAVEEAFARHGTFKPTQELWVTPELEIQLEAMRKPE